MRYRYRNKVLVGKWFENRQDAINDALRAGQARRTEDGQIDWIDHGSLEEETGEVRQIVRPVREEGS